MACSALFKTRGNDIWWHIRTGRWIWENGAIPAADPFSHTAAGAPWTYTDWLSQLIFYGLHNAGGIDLLVLGKALIVGVVAVMMVRSRKVGPGCSSLALFACAAAMHLRLVLKPELFSFMGFAAVWLILLRVNELGKSTWLWVLPPLLALWGNFHRGGTIALVLMVVAVAAWSIDRRRRKLLTVSAAVLALSVGALVLNPGGLYYLTSALALGTSSTLRAVAEWTPLSLSLPWLSIPWFLALCAAWGLGWALARRRADLESLAVLVLVVLSFRAVRFIPFAAIAMFPGLAGDLERLGLIIHRRLKEAVRRELVQAGLFVLGFAALAHMYLATYPPSVRGPGVATWLLPVDVAAFIRDNPPPGKMWNSLNYSGYLLFALSPEVKKVFVDGRGDTVYPEMFIDETLQASADSRIIEKQLDEYQIGFAVIEDSRLKHPNDGILRHPDWALVYWDDRAAVLVRRTAEAGAYLERFAYRELQAGTALERISRLQNDPQSVQLSVDVLANLERAPDSIRAHILAALVHRQRGNQAAFQLELAKIKEMANRRDVEVVLPAPAWPEPAG